MTYKGSSSFFYTILILILLSILALAVNDPLTIGVISDAMKKPIYTGDNQKEIIAFECNVVWGSEYIEPMLNILDEYDVRITFFIGGKWATNNPQLFMKIYEAGHEIGNHGYSHAHHDGMSLEENLEQIEKTNQVIEHYTNLRPKYFAPPYGEYDQRTLKAADSLDMTTIMWSLDTIDWRGDGRDKILSRILSKPHNGAFVLMHPTEDTLEALPILIEELRAKGYNIGCISDALSGHNIRK